MIELLELLLEPGRRAIHCTDMVKLHQPIPMRGYQGAWDWEVPPDIATLLQAKTERVSA